jgi:hypothetical protein
MEASMTKMKTIVWTVLMGLVVGCVEEPPLGELAPEPRDRVRGQLYFPSQTPLVLESEYELSCALGPPAEGGRTILHLFVDDTKQIVGVRATDVNRDGREIGSDHIDFLTGKVARSTGESSAAATVVDPPDKNSSWYFDYSYGLDDILESLEVCDSGDAPGVPLEQLRQYLKSVRAHLAEVVGDVAELEPTPRPRSGCWQPGCMYHLTYGELGAFPIRYRTSTSGKMKVELRDQVTHYESPPAVDLPAGKGTHYVYMPMPEKVNDPASFALVIELRTSYRYRVVRPLKLSSVVTSAEAGTDGLAAAAVE